MNLERLAYDPATVLDFYAEALASLGALSERTWHDRLEVVAEGPTAALWNPEGALCSAELHFAPADTPLARDPTREVFPGSPLTFRLAELLLRKTPGLELERLVFADAPSSHPPEPTVAERLWRTQFADTREWRLLEAFKPDFHFSLFALARCEIQAIDQHWSLHRVAVALPGGEPDDELTRTLDFAQAEPNPEAGIAWPVPRPSEWTQFLQRALEEDLSGELAAINARQQASLRRELERIDRYFEDYARELEARSRRTGKEQVRVKTADRLAAAKAEHTRRRADQVARHEVRIHPHMDLLLVVAERAWRTRLQVRRERELQTLDPLFLPRARIWHVQSE